MSAEKIAKAKERHRVELESYSSRVREYIDKYGNDNCDYLLNMRMSTHYHRGAYNALVELERS